MAQSIHDLAEGIDPLIDPVDAREKSFHASTYYRGAAFFLIGNQSGSRLVSLWTQQIANFDKAIALLKPAPGESFTAEATNASIGPYDIPGYFFKAEKHCRKKLPKLVVIGGYGSSQQESYRTLCAGVLRRGMNYVTYEGPGQPTPRRSQGIGFIADWWTATSSVVDFLFKRANVDTTKIDLMGESFGGPLAPRATSQDPRIAAVVGRDGACISTVRLDLAIPPALNALYDRRVKKEFDQVVETLATNASLPTSVRCIFQQGLYAFNTTSPLEWSKRLGVTVLAPAIVAGLGSCPVCVAKGEASAIMIPCVIRQRWPSP